MRDGGNCREQASGDPIDHRTDVYALGVVLFEMLSGERPFTADQPLGVLLKHLQAPVPKLLELRPDLPLAVEQVMQQALAKDPNDRYPSAGALITVWAAIAPSAPGLFSTTNGCPNDFDNAWPTVRAA